MSSENRYLIAAVSRLTGLPTDTIRAWERRHKFVVPQRNATGVRLYSEDDVARLECARAAVELGHPIRRVATMSNDEIRELVAREDAVGVSGTAAGTASRTVADLLKALEAYDINRAETLVNSAALLMNLDALVCGVLGPFMRVVGDRWESRQLSIAQEHLASQLVRNVIGTITRTSIVSKKRTILSAAPSGEAHEFGLLFAGALAAAAGVRHHALGPNLPAQEVIRAARRMQPDIVVIAMLRNAEDLHAGDYCRELLARLPARCVLWLGGNESGRQALPRESRRAHFITSLEDFSRRISALK